MTVAEILFHNVDITKMSHFWRKKKKKKQGQTTFQHADTVLLIPVAKLHLGTEESCGLEKE